MEIKKKIVVPTGEINLVSHILNVEFESWAILISESRIKAVIQHYINHQRFHAIYLPQQGL